MTFWNVIVFAQVWNITSGERLNRNERGESYMQYIELEIFMGLPVEILKTKIKATRNLRGLLQTNYLKYFLVSVLTSYCDSRQSSFLLKPDVPSTLVSRGGSVHVWGCSVGRSQPSRCVQSCQTDNLWCSIWDLRLRDHCSVLCRQKRAHRQCSVAGGVWLRRVRGNEGLLFAAILGLLSGNLR